MTYNYISNNYQTAQAVFQPGFAGTNPQQVRNQIASEGGFGYTGVQSYATGIPTSYLNPSQRVGIPTGYQNTLGVQAVFQPGFADTSPQQVRNQIASEIGYSGVPGYATGIPTGYQYPSQRVGIPTGYQNTLGVQAVYQPGFAGTNPLQVRNQIARELGNVGMQNYGVGIPVGIQPTVSPYIAY